MKIGPQEWKLDHAVEVEVQDEIARRTVSQTVTGLTVPICKIQNIRSFTELRVVDLLVQQPAYSLCLGACATLVSQRTLSNTQRITAHS